MASVCFCAATLGDGDDVLGRTIRREAPTSKELVDDLGTLRQVGLTNARLHRFRALEQVAAATTETPQLAVHIQIEDLLRRAISVLDQGEYGDMALELFGLAEGTRVANLASRRYEAARGLGITADSFRRRYEPNLLADVADQMLKLHADLELRETRVQLEQRHPADSRLAVQWVERFEAYNRMWTPAWALVSCR